MGKNFLTIFFLLLGLGLSIAGYWWISTRVVKPEPSTDVPGQTTMSVEIEEEFGLKQLRWPALLFVSMLTGIVANQIYERAKYLHARRRKSARLGDFFKAIQSNPRFWMALSISPFLFFATYNYVSKTPDDIVAMFYAFQNGFFWQAVFGGFQK
jgi:hypothetical protein